jgi:hypothetical protein
MIGPTSAAAENSAAVFRLDDGEIFVLGRFEVLRRRQLHHLALGDHRGGGGQHVQRVERADLDHHLEGLAEQEIADQDACLVAPDHPRRRLGAAHVAFVDHVVMQQRRRVHELHAGRQLHMAFAVIVEHLGRRERDHRPQPLAARRDQVVGDLRDHLDIGTGLRQDQFVDAIHAARDKADQLFDTGRFFLVFTKRYDDAQCDFSQSPAAPEIPAHIRNSACMRQAANWRA